MDAHQQDEQKHAEALKLVLDAHKLWVESNGGRGIRLDLSRAYLKKAKLTGAYLREADITHADFVGADLFHSNFTGAYLFAAQGLPEAKQQTRTR